MDVPRVALKRTRAAALVSEAARLAAEADAENVAVLAARAAGVSQWGSNLPPLVLQQVFQLLQWDPAVCGAIRLVCSTWSSLLDALYPGRLRPRRSLAVMVGKMGLFESVTEVDLTGCKNGVCGPLAELSSMMSLRSLSLPSSCAERAVDAEAVCGLTTLTTLRLSDRGQVVGEWVLDLSRLPTVTTLRLQDCAAVTDKEVRALSKLTGLTDLKLEGCNNVTSEGLLAMSSLTALTTLNLSGCNVSTEVLRVVIK
jgi:hypothetical protein